MALFRLGLVMTYFLDTETHRIQPGLLAPPLVCLQFALDDGPVAVAVHGVDPVDELMAQMTDGVIVGHNVAYDMLVMMTQYPELTELILKAYEEDRVLDTLIREKLRVIARGGNLYQSFSLATLAKKYDDTKDANDPWRLRYSELDGVPFRQWPEDAKAYAVHDVEATRNVFQCQGDVLPDEYRQTRAAFVMHAISATGVYTDPVAVAQFESKVNEEYERDMITLLKEGLVRPGGTKNTALAKARIKKAFEKQGLDVPLTKKKQVSLDEEACLLSGDDKLEAYQRYGSMGTLRTRLQGLKKGFNAPINAYFDSLKETGRTSCSKGKDGGPTNGYQLQNMRREAGERECFVPRPGNVFLACDYDSFELVTLSQVCIWTVGYSTLGDAIKGGLDPHLAMAANALGISYESALARYEAKDKSMKKARQGSKIANFGYPGGMGAKSFVSYAKGYGITLTIQEAQDLKNHWLESWPEMSAYFGWINTHPWRTTKRGDYLVDVTTVNQLKSDRQRGGCNYCEACNSYFQGLAAEAAKAAGWDLVRATMTGELQDWGVWNFVHDEYILEGPAENGHRAAMAVKRIMEEGAQPWVPDVPVSASPALMTRWMKDAEPTWKDGVLVPWEG